MAVARTITKSILGQDATAFGLRFETKDLGVMVVVVPNAITLSLLSAGTMVRTHETRWDDIAGT